MKITYDKKIDAIYIKFSEKDTYHISKKVSDNVLVDYSKDGKLIGVEILEASTNPGVTQNLDKVLVETN